MGGRRPGLPSTTSPWSQGLARGTGRTRLTAVADPGKPSHSVCPNSLSVWGVSVGPGNQSRPCRPGREDSRERRHPPWGQNKARAAGPGTMHRGRGVPVSGSRGQGHTARRPQAVQRLGHCGGQGLGGSRPGAGRQADPAGPGSQEGPGQEPLSPALGGGTSRSGGTAWIRRAAADVVSRPAR